MLNKTRRRHWKARVRQLLEPAARSSLAGNLVQRGLAVLILGNFALLLLESTLPLAPEWQEVLQWVEYTVVSVFSLEYLLRLWACAQQRDRPVLGRLRYALRPLMLIDLLAVLPFYLDWGPVESELRFLRLLRLLKIWRYSVGLQTIGRVLTKRRYELGMTLVFGAMLLLSAATLMHYAERQAQPQHFASVAKSLWWAVTTLTTVGYGDTYPITALGRIIGGLVQVTGVLMFSLPAGLLGAAFLEEITLRRERAARRTRRRHAEQAAPAKRCPHCGEELA